MTQVIISKKNSIKSKEKCCLPFNGIIYMLKQTSYRGCFMIPSWPSSVLWCDGVQITTDSINRFKRPVILWVQNWLCDRRFRKKDAFWVMVNIRPHFVPSSVVLGNHRNRFNHNAPQKTTGSHSYVWPSNFWAPPYDTCIIYTCNILYMIHCFNFGVFNFNLIQHFKWMSVTKPFPPGVNKIFWSQFFNSVWKKCYPKHKTRDKMSECIKTGMQ